MVLLGLVVATASRPHPDWGAENSGELIQDSLARGGKVVLLPRAVFRSWLGRRRRFRWPPPFQIDGVKHVFESTTIDMTGQAQIDFKAIDGDACQIDSVRLWEGQ